MVVVASQACERRVLTEASVLAPNARTAYSRCENSMSLSCGADFKYQRRLR